MARSRVIPNLIYGTLGLVAIGAAGYLAVRWARQRRLHGDDPMLSLRRSTRDVGRSVKDAAQQVGKDVKRGVQDTAESFEDAKLEADSLNRI